MIFSISQEIYVNIICGQILKLNIKTKKTYVALDLHNNEIWIRYNPSYNYIQIVDTYDTISIFNGKTVHMSYFDISTNNFSYLPSKYFIHSNSSNIYVNDIENGQLVIKRKGSFGAYIIQQSPDGCTVLLTVKSCPYHYIIPTDVFCQYLFAGEINHKMFKEYEFSWEYDSYLHWISNSSLFTWRGYIICINSKRYINIGNKYCIFGYKPYLIDCLFYFLLPNYILVVGFDKQIEEFPNKYNIVDYNRELNLFISEDHDVYIQQYIGHFVRFKFVGIFDWDYMLVPQNIKIVVECLFELGFIYDVVDEIYRQLLKIDLVTSLVY